MSNAIDEADQVIAVSTSTQNDLVAFKEYIANRITMIPEAPVVTPTSLDSSCQLSIKKPYVLCVGTLEPRKNVVRLANAFLKSKLHEHQLIVAGQVGWGDVKLPQSERIRWLRPVSDAELAYLYRHAEFIAAPSLYEGFGLQIAEAMAFGKAILTSNCSSMPEVAGGAALYVDPNSTEQLIGALNSLGLESAKRGELEKIALNQASKLNWDDTCYRTLEVFFKALEE